MIKPAVDAVGISTGESHSIYFDSKGQAFGFGCTDHGQLGLGIESPIALPTLIPIDDEIIDVQSGKIHTLFRSSNGEIYSTGSGSSCQLGYLESIQKVPRLVEGLKGLRFKKLVCGWFHNIAIEEGGSIYTWGLGVYGQLSVSVETNIISPTLVTNLGEFKIKNASAGLYHSVVVTEDDRLFGFGSNRQGQLGTQTDSSISWTPQEIPIDLEKGESIDLIQSGMNHTIIITSSGNIYGWGENGLGQLGLGDRETRFLPIKILDGRNTKFKILSCGAYHTIVVDTDNNMWVWGQGTEFQLGQGKAEILQEPTILPKDTFGGAEILAVETGWAHTLVLLNSVNI